MGRSSGSRSDHSLFLWRRICARLSRHPTKDGRPSRPRGQGAHARAKVSSRVRTSFPAAIDDAVHAYQWLLDRGGEPSKMILAGDSAGGGLAVSTAIALRDRLLPMCTGIVALCPWADLTCSGESMISRAAVDIECTRARLLEMARHYMNGADPSQPLASPVFADLAGLPPLLCVVGGDEILLDDSIRLVRNAGIAGIDATLFIAAGMQHEFPIWAGAFPEANAPRVLRRSGSNFRCPRRQIRIANQSYGFSKWESFCE